MKELLKELRRFNEEESISVDDIINITNQTYEDNLHYDVENLDKETAEVKPIKIGDQRAYIINYSDIAVCPLETFKDAISDYTSLMLNNLPDGVARYFNRNQFEEDALSDKVTVQQISSFDKDGWGEIKNFEEVNYNGNVYIVMEIR